MNRLCLSEAYSNLKIDIKIYIFLKYNDEYYYKNVILLSFFNPYFRGYLYIRCLGMNLDVFLRFCHLEYLIRKQFLMSAGVKMPGIGGGLWILSDFRALSFFSYWQNPVVKRILTLSGRISGNLISIIKKQNPLTQKDKNIIS